MGKHLLGAALLALILPCATPALGDGLATYFESSANQQPRSNAGLSLTGDKLRLRAGLAMRTPGDATQIGPNLSSGFTLGKNLDIETKVNFTDWNSGADTSFDTRVHLKSLGPFLEELEGGMRRSPDGVTSQLLRLGFYQIVGSASAVVPVTLTGRAIYEVTRGVALEDSRRVGLETRLAGLVAPFLPGAGALALKLERVSGARTESASTVRYDQSWTVRNDTQLGFKFKMLRATYSTANEFEPSIDFTWRSEF